MTDTSPASERRIDKPRSFNARFNAGLTVVLAKLKVEEVPHIRRIIITVVGGTILVIGTALVALPVPGSGPVVILGGLAILGTEYAWARRWMRKGKLMAQKALSKTQKLLSFKEKPESVAASNAPSEARETGKEPEPIRSEKSSLQP